MRLLLLFTAGDESFFVQLAAALCDAGIETTAALAGPLAPGGEERLQGVGVRTVRLGLFKAAALNALGRESSAPSVTLAWGGEAAKLLLRSRLPGRRAAWLSEAAWLPPAGSGQTGSGQIGGAQTGGGQTDGRGFDALALISPALLRLAAAKGWSRRKLKVVPPFVAGGSFKPLERRALALPAGARVLAAGGFLHAPEPYAPVMKALALLANHYLLLAGDGAARPALEAMAVAAGVKPRLRLLGWLDDIRPVLASCDALLAAPESGSLNPFAAAALTVGTPLIALRGGAIDDFVVDGESALLAAARGALVRDAVLRLEKDGGLRSRLASGGRRVAGEHFERRTVVAGVKAWLEALAAGTEAGTES